MARDDTTLHVDRPQILLPAPRLPRGNPESRVGFSSVSPAFLWLPEQQAPCTPTGARRPPRTPMGQKKGRGRAPHAPATTSKARAQTPPLPRRLTQLLRHGLDRARIPRDDEGWAEVGPVSNNLRATRMEVMNIALDDPDRYEHDPRTDRVRATRKRSYGEEPTGAAGSPVAKRRRGGLGISPPPRKQCHVGYELTKRFGELPMPRRPPVRRPLATPCRSERTPCRRARRGAGHPAGHGSPRLRAPCPRGHLTRGGTRGPPALLPRSSGRSSEGISSRTPGPLGPIGRRRPRHEVLRRDLALLRRRRHGIALHRALPVSARRAPGGRCARHRPP